MPTSTTRAADLLSEKKKFKAPHTLVILTAFIILAVILTWLIPAGQFDRFKNGMGILVIDPASFHIIGSQPVSLLAIPDFIIEGFMKSADLFFFCFLRAALLM